MEWQMYISKNILGVNSVVTNYKIRHNKNRPVMRLARHSLAWPGHFFVIICGDRKMENTIWTCKATFKSSHGGTLAQYVSKPEHWSIVVGRWILLLFQFGICEQGRKSYVASLQVNDPVNFFLQTMLMKVNRESFLLWTIPNTWYLIEYNKKMTKFSGVIGSRGCQSFIDFFVHSNIISMTHIWYWSLLG